MLRCSQKRSVTVSPTRIRSIAVCLTTCVRPVATYCEAEVAPAHLDAVVVVFGRGGASRELDWHYFF